MRGNNKRKLITQHLLDELSTKYASGVPLARLIRDYHLGISNPHLRKLLFIYIDTQDSSKPRWERQALFSAIFPPWLQGKEPGVYTQPDNWTYRGKFPMGKWELILLPVHEMFPGGML